MVLEEAVEETIGEMIVEVIVKCLKQLVQIVEEIAKFLSNQINQNLFTVMVVSKEMMITEKIEVEVEVVEMTVEAETTVEVETTVEDQLCIKQFVQTVDNVVKFLSDQMETNLFIAALVLNKAELITLVQIETLAQAEIQPQAINQIKMVKNTVR